MAAAGHADRQQLVYARFQTRLASTIRSLITPELIEEHRRCPLGPHGDALARVLNFFRRPPRYGLYSRRAMREWQLIRLPVDPRKAPSPVEDRIYSDPQSAHHAVFLRHVEDLMAERSA